MKEIKAYIRQSMTDAVVDALEAMPGIPGVAVTPTYGFGHVVDDGQPARVEMTRLEIEVPDAIADSVVDCVCEHARTGAGHVGDGRIYVTELARTVRIADGAEGEAAF
ncbi:P-II family nitrogen regulator [Guyparkeria sp. SB14A]|uniref:P-II family nitrogen regulator n=1 Tax=Guyparkeria sp. SB14A TaxID=2571147 RepID=UPI00145C6175|nr:P-II family nitrogen regulator [Guyparkeria sp. SB14A]